MLSLSIPFTRILEKHFMQMAHLFRLVTLLEASARIYRVFFPSVKWGLFIHIAYILRKETFTVSGAIFFASGTLILDRVVQRPIHIILGGVFLQ